MPLLTRTHLGQGFHVLASDPNSGAGYSTLVQAGDVLFRTDLRSIYTNPTGGATTWVPVLTGTLPAALSTLLIDNNATAWRIGSTGLLNILTFDTTDGDENIILNGASQHQIQTGGLLVTAGNVNIGTGLLRSLSTAVENFAVNVLAPTFTIVTNHAGGNVEQNVGPMLARPNGWRLVRAYTRSTGGTAGTLTLLDATSGNAMTNAIVPGNANVVVNAAQIITAQETVASLATPVWAGATNPPATTCYTEWVGL